MKFFWVFSFLFFSVFLMAHEGQGNLAVSPHRYLFELEMIETKKKLEELKIDLPLYDALLEIAKESVMGGALGAVAGSLVPLGISHFTLRKYEDILPAAVIYFSASGLLSALINGLVAQFGSSYPRLSCKAALKLSVTHQFLLTFLNVVGFVVADSYSSGDKEQQEFIKNTVLISAPILATAIEALIVVYARYKLHFEKAELEGILRQQLAWAQRFDKQGSVESLKLEDSRGETAGLLG